jgi:hypothetical protein
MRTLHLVIGVVLNWSLTELALGQASFELKNYNAQFTLDAPVDDWSGNHLTGADWRFELYGGLSQDSLSPAIALFGAHRVAATLFVPGYFRSSTTLIVPEVPEGGWAWLQVKAWDVRLGSTYEAAVDRGLGGVGQSQLFYAEGGFSTAPTPSLPMPLVGLHSFSVLQVIPEPSTLALLALGGALGFGVGGCTRTRRPGAPDPRCARPHSGG